MKKLALLLTIALVVGGCASEEPESRDVATEAEPTQTAAAPTAEIPSTEEEITLTGTIGCSHCTFKVVDHCAAAISTADGVVYVLEGIDQESQLFTERYSGKEVRVIGVPREEEGVRYVAVKSHEMDVVEK